MRSKFYLVLIISLMVELSAQVNEKEMNRFFNLIDNYLEKLKYNAENLTENKNSESFIQILKAKKEYDEGINQLNEQLYKEQNKTTENLMDFCSNQNSDMEAANDKLISTLLEKYMLAMLSEEGYCYFTFDWGGYLSLIKPKLNSEQTAFLSLYSKYRNQPVVSDAAILVGSKVLSQRIHEWNKILNIVNDPLLKNEARIEMYGYMELLLLGTDNSPAFINKKLDKGIKRTIEEIIKGDSAFESVQIIKKYYDKLKLNNFKYTPSSAKELSDKLTSTKESIF